jgi:hypothetical protein
MSDLIIGVLVTGILTYLIAHLKIFSLKRLANKEDMTGFVSLFNLVVVEVMVLGAFLIQETHQSLIPAFFILNYKQGNQTYSATEKLLKDHLLPWGYSIIT